jgi:hypothetical protein
MRCAWQECNNNVHEIQSMMGMWMNLRSTKNMLWRAAAAPFIVELDRASQTIFTQALRVIMALADSKRTKMTSYLCVSM